MPDIWRARNSATIEKWLRAIEADEKLMREVILTNTYKVQFLASMWRYVAADKALNETQENFLETLYIKAK